MLAATLPLGVALPLAAQAQPAPAVTVSHPLDSTKPADKSDISGVPGTGVTIKLDDSYSLNIRSRFQLRYQLSVPQPSASGERKLDQLVNVSTARVYLSGNVLSPKLAYTLQLAVAGRDYRDGAVSPIFDAYLDWKGHRDASVQVGQFFVPFDRLRTVREFALQLADRPRPVQELTLDRDVGVVLYSDKFLGDKSPIAYRVGVFGGGGTNLSAGKKPGALVVGRLELRPLGAIDDDREGDLERRDKPALAVGTAVAGNINSNRLRSTTGTTYTGGTVDFLHVATDLTFKWKGFALQAEYLYKKGSKDRINSVGTDGKQLVEQVRSAHGWILQASYIFETPVEIVGRLSRLYAIGATDPSLVSEIAARGQEVAGGINYYVNGHRFKFQADWIARLTPEFKRPDHLVHVQLDATF